MTVNKRQSKAMADQVATVSKVRLLGKMGRVSQADMHQIENALRVQFDLE